MDELRDLLMRIEDLALRDQILRALERRGEITPEALLEEIRLAIDQLNTEAALRQLDRALGPYDAPNMPQPGGGHPEVVIYGPSTVPGTGDGPFRWIGDSTADPQPQWFDDRNPPPYRIVSGTTISIDEN